MITRLILKYYLIFEEKHHIWMYALLNLKSSQDIRLSDSCLVLTRVQ